MTMTVTTVSNTVGATRWKLHSFESWVPGIGLSANTCKAMTVAKLTINWVSSSLIFSEHGSNTQFYEKRLVRLNINKPVTFYLIDCKNKMLHNATLKTIDREFEFYDFFSFLKFNEFYEFFVG